MLLAASLTSETYHPAGGGTIIFHLGDSKGLKIEGNLLKNSFCMVEVKPKSLLKQWFKF